MSGVLCLCVAVRVRGVETASGVGSVVCSACPRATVETAHCVLCACEHQSIVDVSHDARARPNMIKRAG